MLRRGRGSCFFVRLLWRRTLDLGLVEQLLHSLFLRLLVEMILDLRTHFLKLRNRALALFLDLDDVEAELGLHRRGNLAGLELEGDISEFRNHLILQKETEIASLRAGTRILGDFLRDGLEILALCKARLDGLGLVLSLDEDVTRPDFLLRLDVLDGVRVELLDRVLGHRILAGLLEENLHQRLFAQEFDTGGEILALTQLGVFRGLGHKLHIDEKADDLLALLLVERHARRDLAEGNLQFALGQRFSVDRRDDGVRVGLGRGILGVCGGHGQHRKNGRRSQETAKACGTITHHG